MLPKNEKRVAGEGKVSKGVSRETIEDIRNALIRTRNVPPFKPTEEQLRAEAFDFLTTGRPGTIMIRAQTLKLKHDPLEPYLKEASEILGLPIPPPVTHIKKHR